MRLPFKITFLVAIMALTTNTVFADTSTFKSEDDKIIYAFGASFAKNFEQFFTKQDELNIKVDNNQLVSGIQDALNGKSKLTDEEIQTTLQSFQIKMSEIQRAKQEKEEKIRAEQAKENAKIGDEYRAKFAKEKDVEKTQSGLLYRIDKKGQGVNAKSSDTVVVHYKGTLINGTVFDSSYENKEPVTFPLDAVIDGWKEGLTHINKGGKITLVIPPELAYGEQTVGTIPGNSTLIFEVELLDINPPAKETPAENKDAAMKKDTVEHSDSNKNKSSAESKAAQKK